MKLTDIQIKNIVSQMNCGKKYKNTLIKQALNGDHGARFVIMGYAKRKQLI